MKRVSWGEVEGKRLEVAGLAAGNEVTLVALHSRTKVLPVSCNGPLPWKAVCSITVRLFDSVLCNQRYKR